MHQHAERSLDVAFVCLSVRPSVTLWYKPLRRLALFVRILQVARLNDVVVIRMRRRQIPDNVDF